MSTHNICFHGELDYHQIPSIIVKYSSLTGHLVLLLISFFFLYGPVCDELSPPYALLMMMIWYLTSLSMLCKSYRDDEGVIMMIFQ